MANTVSVHFLKKHVEQKAKKKMLIKIMWNEKEKLTLFITPNMKVNSFIHDEREGYLFYDPEGKPIKNEIPCLISPKALADGKVKLDQNILIYGKPLSKEDMNFLKKEQAHDK